MQAQQRTEACLCKECQPGRKKRAVLNAGDRDVGRYRWSGNQRRPMEPRGSGQCDGAFLRRFSLSACICMRSRARSSRWALGGARRLASKPTPLSRQAHAPAWLRPLQVALPPIVRSGTTERNIEVACDAQNSVWPFLLKVCQLPPLLCDHECLLVPRYPVYPVATLECSSSDRNQVDSSRSSCCRGREG